jgi:hypothetical protein
MKGIQRINQKKILVYLGFILCIPFIPVKLPFLLLKF